MTDADAPVVWFEFPVYLAPDDVGDGSDQTLDDAAREILYSAPAFDGLDEEFIADLTRARIEWPEETDG